MKRFFLCSALAISLIGSASAFAQTTPDGYFCKPTIFGQCMTTYAKPATVEAVKAYVADSEEAVKWVLETFESVNTAHYSTKRAEVIVELKKGYNRDHVSMPAILAHFNEKELYVETGVVMGTQFMQHLWSSKNRPLANRYGRARYEALREVRFSLDEEPSADAVKSAKKAFAPVRRDSFGNITIFLK